jgi:hypothetical protein
MLTPLLLQSGQDHGSGRETISALIRNLLLRAARPSKAGAAAAGRVAVRNFPDGGSMSIAK